MHKCTKIIQLVTDEFDFLFEQFGFQVVHSENYRESDERCFIILASESQGCRIKILHELGFVGVMLGTSQTPSTWVDDEDGVTLWYFIGHVLDFIERKHVNLQQMEERQNLLRQLTMRDELTFWARKLESNCERVLSLFSDEALLQRIEMDGYLQAERIERSRQRRESQQ